MSHDPSRRKPHHPITRSRYVNYNYAAADHVFILLMHLKLYSFYDYINDVRLHTLRDFYARHLNR